MKRIKQILAATTLIFAFALLWNCTRDNTSVPEGAVAAKNGSVEFGVSGIAAPSQNLARAARSAAATDVLKNATSVIITIAKAGVSTNTIYPRKK